MTDAIADTQEAVAPQPLAPDDALQQERVLGAVGQREERADGGGEVGVDLACDRHHVVIGGQCRELFSARQNHVLTLPSLVRGSQQGPGKCKSPRPSRDESNLAVPPLLLRQIRRNHLVSDDTRPGSSAFIYPAPCIGGCPPRLVGRLRAVASEPQGPIPTVLRARFPPSPGSLSLRPRRTLPRQRCVFG